jgi:hypothetical protein
VLGLKYVELTKGHSHNYLKDGDSIPLSQTNVPVQFDQLYNTFDAKTRQASQSNLQGFGNTFAGRGLDVNTTISNLPRLFGVLTPVMANLSAPSTQLGYFFQQLGRAARIVAPVAQQNSQNFTWMADTFGAISHDPNALKATISQSPPTLDVSTASLRAQTPFLGDTAAFAHDLRFAVHDLRGALPVLNPTLEAGIGVLRRTVPLQERLKSVMAALRDLTTTPTTNIALRALVGTVTTLNPQLRFIGPYVTVCNYWNYWWTMLADHFSEADPTGMAQRALINTAPPQTDGIGGQGAALPANGQGVLPHQVPQFLHGQPYGAAINPNGTADCEAVQRGYPKRLATGVPSTLQIATDPHTPGSLGPVFKSLNDANLPPNQRQLGALSVPPGQTFSREPQTGIGLPTNLQTP